MRVKSFPYRVNASLVRSKAGAANARPMPSTRRRSFGFRPRGAAPRRVVVAGHGRKRGSDPWLERDRIDSMLFPESEPRHAGGSGAANEDAEMPNAAPSWGLGPSPTKPTIAH